MPAPIPAVRKSLMVRLDNPAVHAAISDLEVMRCWETLRDSEQPTAVSELAAQHRVPLETMQRSLDLLVAAGLATRLKATARQRKITYRTTARELYVSWNKSDPTHLAFVADLRLQLRRMSRRVLEQHDGDIDLDQVRKPGVSTYANMMLDEAEIKAVLAALNTLDQVIDAARLRANALARERAASPAESGHGASAPGTAKGPQQDWSPYHLSVEFRPLRHAEPAVPTFSLFDAEYTHRLVEARERNAIGILTPRELEVARLLTHGESRPAIARRLGLSINTISATTKRIYAKLGVHSRAEFATRMEAA